MPKCSCLLVVALPGALADAATGTSSSSQAIWNTIGQEPRQTAVVLQQEAKEDMAASDAVISAYGVQNQAPADQDGTARIAKILICLILGGSTVWFCRQNWSHVETAMADIQAGVRYSAVPCDGEVLLTVEPEESARRAPLRTDDQEQASWLHLFIARCKDTVQRWASSSKRSRCQTDEGSEKDDPCTPEEKQGLLGGHWEDEEEGRSDVSTEQASTLFNGDEDSMAAIMKLRPSVNDSVGDEEEVDSARPIIGSEREELLSR